jgi:hypothetical protein
MERVETLVQKLQQQLKEGAPVSQLLLTTQMLQHELVHTQSKLPNLQNNKPVIVSMPVNVLPLPVPEAQPLKQETKPIAADTEKTVELLQVDEAAIEAELEEIKRNAALMNQIGVHSKPSLLFNSTDDDIPTLSQGKTIARSLPSALDSKEINESVAQEKTSLNDIHRETKVELSEKLTDMPVKDLKKAIGINDRFLYINELFRGDEVMYERSIKTINSFSIWPEAEYWIKRELKTKLGWIDTDQVVIQFDQLVKRRFS